MAMQQKSDSRSDSRSDSQRGNQNAAGSGSGQDRNQDGRGRGNFSDHEEHVRAGQQSHKNDPNHSTATGSATSTASTTATATRSAETSEQEPPQGLQQLREIMDSFQKDREFHLNRVKEIDAAFMEVREQIDNFVVGLQGNQPQSNQSHPAARRRGRPHQNRVENPQGQAEQHSGGRGGRGKTRSTRNGNETGTNAMIRLLEQNGGSMEGKELRQQAQQAGVSSPYSSLYSLERSGKVSRQGSLIVLQGDQGHQDESGSQPEEAAAGNVHD